MTDFHGIVLNDHFGIVHVRKTSDMPGKFLAVDEGCQQDAEPH